MATMTRGQFAIKLVEWLGIPASELTAHSGGFGDTSGTYLDAVTSWLKAEGISTGWNGDFHPGDTISRAEVIVMLARAFGMDTSSVNAFTDVGSDNWYGGFINQMASLGIVSGIGNGLFDPMGAFNLAHLDGLFQNMENAGFSPDTWTSSIGGEGTGGTDPPPAVGDDDIRPPDEDPEGTDTPGEPPFEEEGDDDSQEEEDFFRRTERLLRDVFGIDITDEVKAFIQRAWDGNWTNDDMRIEMFGETWFHDRFPGIQLAIDGGGDVPTPEEYIQMEVGFRNALRRAGFPPEFYDGPEDFARWIGEGRSVIHVEQDIADQFDKVFNTDESILQWFESKFGVSGATALAMFFLDPEKSADMLADAADAAMVGGAAAQFLFDLSVESADKLVARQITYNQARAGFGQLSELAPLFQETVGERFEEDLDEMDEGLDFVFGIDGEGRRLATMRLRQRQAAFGPRQQAAVTQTGVLGLQSAQ